MDFHRWTALGRAYDLSIRHNRWILVLTAVGAMLGFVLHDGDIQTRFVQAIAGAATVFLAGALAKELDPARPAAALLATALALSVVGLLRPISPVVLLWLMGDVRFLNRSTGLRPKRTDVILLLVAAVGLAWWETALFGVLAGVMLITDALLPDGEKLYAALGALVIFLSGGWFLAGDPVAAVPSLWLGTALVVMAIAIIPVILCSYIITSTGDADERPLNPTRVQAGQVFALGTGLLLASWLGNEGVTLLAGLWAAVLGILIYRLVVTRLTRSALSL